MPPSSIKHTPKKPDFKNQDVKDYWEVTPHLNSSYDSVLIAVEDDPDARKAMNYAKGAVEMLWDQSYLDDMNITVSIKRVIRDPRDIDDGE